MAETPLNLLIPVLDGPPSDAILSLVNDILANQDGEGTLLSVVEVPEERSLSEGAMVVRRRRSRLRKLGNLHGGRDLRPVVRTSHSVESGVRAAVEENDNNLMLLRWRPEKGQGVVGRLVANPPCDLALVKEGNREGIRSVMVPVRGGPQARLALQMAEAIARQHDATLALVHITSPRWDEYRRAMEDRFFQAIKSGARYERTEFVGIGAESIESALLAESKRHDVVVLGATGRDARSSYLMGPIPQSVAMGTDATVIAVKTREPVTAGTFGLPPVPVPVEHRDISELVDRWFAENTFHSHEFRNLRYLLDLKERQGVRISLALPALNEEATIGKIITTFQRHLMHNVPFIDELVVIDSDSADRTAEIAGELGVPVFKHPEILPGYGSYRGKGEALWKSLQVTTGDIVVWIDSDITGIHPKFVYGLVGPLLTQPHVGFVKGFYRRPLRLGGELLTTGGGRVTELTARPLLNLFYPQLSGVVQPLAGEMAGRRSVLETLPFFTGYGVETGLLIDILKQFGLRSLAQVDLELRVHRNQSLLSLSKMAFAIIQVVMQRLENHDRVQLMEELSPSMKLIHYSPNELFLEVKEIREHERPPIITLPEYAARTHRLAASTA